MTAEDLTRVPLGWSSREAFLEWLARRDAEVAAAKLVEMAERFDEDPIAVILGGVNYVYSVLVNEAGEISPDTEESK